MRQFMQTHRRGNSTLNKNKSNSIRLCGAAVAALLISSVAHADSYSWTGFVASGDWDAVSLPPPLNVIPGNWYDNTTSSNAIVIPSPADDVTFGSVAYSFLGVTMTGPHSINSITFDTPATFAISNSGGLNTSLTLSDGSLNQTANDTGVQTISVPLAIGTDANWSLNGTGTIVVNQPVSSNNAVFGLSTTGPGNLTLAGQNSYRGNTFISGSGAVLLTGSIGVAIGVSDPADFVVDSQAGAKFMLGSTATDASTLIATYTFVGKNQTGAFTQNGGTHITRLLGVGYTGNAIGTYNLLNGVLVSTTFGTLVGGSSTSTVSDGGGQGTFNQYGAVHQTAQLEIGAAYAASGTYNLSGGTLSVGGATFIGEVGASSGIFTQTGGQNTTQSLVLGNSITVNTDPVVPGGWNRITNKGGTIPLVASTLLSTPAQPALTAKYYLSGGTLTTEAVEGLSAGTDFYFNGGTLKPTSNLTTFISGLDAAVVQAGGAVIDTNGFNVTVPQPLSHDTSLGVTSDGGLTKNGNGILTLTGAVTYTGPTVVNGGVLSIPATSGVLSSTQFTANAGTQLTLNGGTLSPVGSITVNGAGSVLAIQFINDGTINITGGMNSGTFYNDATNLMLATGSHTNIGTVATPGGTLSMQNGGTIQLKGTLVNNGTISGEVDVNSGGLLSGGGRADTISVLAGGVLHAGNSPGTMYATNATLAGNSTFEFDINSATGTAGTNWSLLAVDDELTVDGIQGKSPTILKLMSVSGQGDTESPLTDFNPYQAYSWEFASFDSYQGSSGHPFQIDASDFENATYGGTFSSSFVDGVLSIKYTPVPEPTSFSLLAVVSLSCLRRRRDK